MRAEGGLPSLSCFDKLSMRLIFWVIHLPLILSLSKDECEGQGRAGREALSKSPRIARRSIRATELRRQNGHGVTHLGGVLPDSHLWMPRMKRDMTIEGKLRA